MEKLKLIASKATGFQLDSRKIAEGNLFFALEGNKVKGARFLEDVARQGAIGAVVDKGYRGKDYGLRLIFVEDVEGSLKQLARDSITGEYVIGITGSVGKTTTKEFLFQLLEGLFPVWRSPGNANSQLGLPIGLLNRDRTRKVLIQEYGVSEKGNMDSLLQIIRPSFGVLTKIAKAHLDGLKDLQGVFEEKAKLLKVSEKRVFPQGLPLKGTTFGKGGDYWIEEERFFCTKKERLFIEAPFKESHFYQNLLIAFAVCKELEVDNAKLVEKCKRLQTGQMRFEKVQKKEMLLIKDMYNASEDSMKSALANLPIGKRKVGVLGKMAELGEFSEQVHYELGLFAKEKLDALFVLGKGAESMIEGFLPSKKPCFFFDDKEKLSQKLLEFLQPDDVLLIKGSRFLEMKTIFDKVVGSL